MHQSICPASNCLAGNTAHRPQHLTRFPTASGRGRRTGSAPAGSWRASSREGAGVTATGPSWCPAAARDGRGLRQSRRVPRDRSVRLRDRSRDPDRWRVGARIIARQRANASRAANRGLAQGPMRLFAAEERRRSRHQQYVLSRRRTRSPTWSIGSSFDHGGRSNW